MIMRGQGFNKSYRANKESGKFSMSIVMITWILILLWIAFLAYCWKFGMLDKKKIQTVKDEINVAINQAESAILKQVPHSDTFSSFNSASRDPDEVHVIFSTDCTPYQDWQTIMVFHSARSVGQKGPVTRIASGCDEEKKTALVAMYQKLYPQYHVHFTPDFKSDNATKKKYDFYNKPWGLKHWLENAEPPIPADTVIALIDPDMIFLRPLTTQIAGVQNNIVDRTVAEHEIFDRVKPGYPAAQTYGLGAPWTNDNHKKFNRGQICGEGSPCLIPNEFFGQHHYSVGPPYVVHKADMIRIAQSWTTFVPRVYKGYPYLLAEMYAYSMAAAHENLPHLQMENYMVSNVDSPGEGWPWIDKLDDHEVCRPPLELDGGKHVFHPGIPMPTVVHYCQNYKADVVGFQKRRVPKDIFSCEHPLLADIPGNVMNMAFNADDKTLSWKEKNQALKKKRNAFMTCTIYRAMNAALVDFKKRMCENNPATSYDRTVQLKARGD